MQTWDLRTLDVAPHRPEVLRSDDEARAIAIHLPPGERLDEHQVHERAWLVVADGSVTITEPDGSRAELGAGGLAHFPPNERREIEAVEDARLLLLLSPWPGDGHPSRRR